MRTEALLPHFLTKAFHSFGRRLLVNIVHIGHKWGNSASVRIPAAVLQAAKLRLDDSVDVREESGRIVIDLSRARNTLSRNSSKQSRREIYTTKSILADGGQRGLVMPPAYVPDAGDICVDQLRPATGHEQLDTGPPLCSARLPTTPKTSLMLCCPMPTQIKSYSL